MTDTTDTTDATTDSPPLTDALTEIQRVWDGHDDFTTGGFPYVAFIIQQDLADMEADEWDERECIEELADVCINAMRMMLERGYDPTVEIPARVRNHEQKDTDALVAKYQRLYREQEGGE